MDNSDEPPRATDVLLTDTEGGLEAVGTPLFRDRSFWGMTATQFLGAFNDNLFKQLVLLLAVGGAAGAVAANGGGAAAAPRSGPDLQSLAMVLFASPFLLFSRFAGFLSER